MKYGDIVEFKEKTNNGKFPHDGMYIILDVSARMKNPTTGEWLDAIVYAKCRHNIPYIREKQDFLDKFKLVKDETDM